MSRTDETTEFEGRVEINKAGEWSWKIVATNGKWPYWLSGSGSMSTSGTTWTRWGAKAEARRALKRIRRYIDRSPAIIIP